MKLAQRFLITTIACLVGLLFLLPLWTNLHYSPELLSKDLRESSDIRDYRVPTIVNTAQVNELSLNKEIGVWATRSQGKWDGEFSCNKSGTKVKVIQTVDYKRLAQCQALFLIHNAGFSWQELTRYRPPGQIWIYMTFESPYHSGNFNHDFLINSVNWTFTYSSNATFPSPYGGFFRDRPLVPSNDTTNWAKGKQGVVCALVSNCGSSWGRMGIINKIASYIPTDIYGSCGNKACPRDRSCNQMLSKYKFYLAFENSECRDYITEKFWHNALNFNLVPIVYGGAPEDYEKVAPPKSFIHVKNFPSVRHLAEYLKILDGNDDLYNEYFQWKKLGRVEGNILALHYEPDITMCRIKSRLLEVDKSRDQRSDREVEKMYSYVHSCR